MPGAAILIDPPFGPSLVRTRVGAVQIPMTDAPPPVALARDPDLGALVARVARFQDRAAFGALFAYFAPRLKSYLLRVGAEDGVAEEILQEVMITVWRRADLFDPALAGVTTWVFTIARNKRIDRLRRETKPSWDPHDPALVPEAEPPADDLVAAEQTRRRLVAAIDQLPEEQVALLKLAYYGDKSHGEIAAETRLPLGTVKSRIRLALARLRAALADGRDGSWE